MEKRRWFRSFALIAVWTYAAATWASIAHHLLGLPDLVPLAGVTAGIASAAWSLRPALAQTLRKTQTDPQGASIRG